MNIIVQSWVVEWIVHGKIMKYEPSENYCLYFEIDDCIAFVFWNLNAILLDDLMQYSLCSSS